jgi:hypothetical protein
MTNFNTLDSLVYQNLSLADKICPELKDQYIQGFLSPQEFLSKFLEELNRYLISLSREHDGVKICNDNLWKERKDLKEKILIQEKYLEDFSTENINLHNSIEELKEKILLMNKGIK